MVRFVLDDSPWLPPLPPPFARLGEAVGETATTSLLVRVFATVVPPLTVRTVVVTPLVSLDVGVGVGVGDGDGDEDALWDDDSGALLDCEKKRDEDGGADVWLGEGLLEVADAMEEVDPCVGVDEIETAVAEEVPAEAEGLAEVEPVSELSEES
ncbi:MAG: hypothetical protein M1814_000453 [Vezdaea aestivalis]|nr:MAG: hypothetical protein M1814_000453 [Vezdaea aestivalis]